MSNYDLFSRFILNILFTHFGIEKSVLMSSSSITFNEEIMFYLSFTNVFVVFGALALSALADTTWAALEKSGISSMIFSPTLAYAFASTNVGFWYGCSGYNISTAFFSLFGFKRLF